jgi:hypothetical protein
LPELVFGIGGSSESSDGSSSPKSTFKRFAINSVDSGLVLSIFSFKLSETSEAVSELVFVYQGDEIVTITITRGLGLPVAISLPFVFFHYCCNSWRPGGLPKNAIN